MALEQEIATYQKELANLLQQEGKYALIHESTVSGVFETYEDAIIGGLREIWPETVLGQEYPSNRAGAAFQP